MAVEMATVTTGDVFAGVVGQDHAVRLLRAAAGRPVHAYLLAGPPGLGQQAIARGFAAMLLCPDGGCGHCEVCRRVLSGVHPDVVEVERAGAALSVGDAAEVVRLAQRKPLEGRRQVIVVSDLHTARLAAPVLLKTLEEPAGDTVFVLMADFVPAELATVASRCVSVELAPLAPEALAAALRSEGIDAERAAELAHAAGGSPERARLLASDTHLAQRRALWRSVPTRLDGTGAVAAALASELLTSAEDATQPLQIRHAEELEALAAEAETWGQRGVPGRKAVEDRQRREERRWRIDELRAGLAVLAGAYRDRMSQANEQRLAALGAAVAAIEDAGRELIRNPNELLMLEALLVKLSAVPG
ncbi:MAG TPA: DNA polymerase III subunit delta' [Acidimicrobiaceae bacterium]|nr:DNA polymerase III subunit delta' [Acidimicrobiaceae bacterium]